MKNLYKFLSNYRPKHNLDYELELKDLSKNGAIHKWCEQIASKLNKDEFELLIDTIIRALATKGIECPDFPNREDLENITYKKDK